MNQHPLFTPLFRVVTDPSPFWGQPIHMSPGTQGVDRYEREGWTMTDLGGARRAHQNYRSMRWQNSQGDSKRFSFKLTLIRATEKQPATLEFVTHDRKSRFRERLIFGVDSDEITGIAMEPCYGIDQGGDSSTEWPVTPDDLFISLQWAIDRLPYFLSRPYGLVELPAGL